MSPLRTRLDNKIDRSDGPGRCWNFTGTKDRFGYGRIGKGGRFGGMALPHRVAWELFVGAIPENMNVLHRCDNPSCCNPKHLFLGTQQDNVDDCIRKGRHAFGESCGKSKLTVSEVTSIRARLKNGESQRLIAGDYGVTQGAISRIHTGSTWKQCG